MRAFLISSTVPIATGPTTTGDTGLDGTEEGGDQEGDGVLRILTGLTDGDFDGDLTTGAGGAATASFTGFSWGFLVISNSGLFAGPFPWITCQFFPFLPWSLDLFLLVSLNHLAVFSQYLF